MTRLSSHRLLKCMRLVRVAKSHGQAVEVRRV